MFLKLYPDFPFSGVFQKYIQKNGKFHRALPNTPFRKQRHVWLYSLVFVCVALVFKVQHSQSRK